MCGQLFKPLLYFVSGQQVVRVSTPSGTLSYIIEDGRIKAMEYSISWRACGNLLSMIENTYSYPETR